MAGTLQNTIILIISNILHLIPVLSVDASTTYSPQGKEFIKTLHSQICNWKFLLASIYNDNQKEENTKKTRFSKAYEHLRSCKVVWCFYSHLQKVQSIRSSVNYTQKQLFRRPFYKQNTNLTTASQMVLS